MQVAVLSDIHANRHALEAVLADVAATAAREIWCLGDVVGYGADPERLRRPRARQRRAVRSPGNHDLGVTGALPLDEFSPGAALAARWTQEVIDPDRLEWLAVARAARAPARASACSTAARATRSGSTS